MGSTAPEPVGFRLRCRFRVRAVMWMQAGPMVAQHRNGFGHEGQGLAIRMDGRYLGTMEPTFEQMSPAERIEYLQDLWDRLAEEPEAVPVTDAQRVELRRRVAAYRADPDAVVPWEQVLERARGR